MNILKRLLPRTGHTFVRAGFLPSAARRIGVLAIAAGAATLPLQASAGLISTVVVGDSAAPYTYNLTVEFANSNYYNFVLRSTATSLTGENFINTVASYPAAHLTVVQQSFSFGDYVNGITVGNDTSGGYDSTTGQFWAYWNGTATDPVQWTSPADFGESGRTITPGQADGWVYSTGTTAPQATSFAVPEPGTGLLVVLPLAGFLCLRRLRRGRDPIPGLT